MSITLFRSELRKSPTGYKELDREDLGVNVAVVASEEVVAVVALPL